MQKNGNSQLEYFIYSGWLLYFGLLGFAPLIIIYNESKPPIRELPYLILISHIYKLPIGTIELILQESKLLRSHHIDSEAILHLPFPSDGDKSFVYICFHIRMHIERKFLHSHLIDKAGNLIFERVSKHDA